MLLHACGASHACGAPHAAHACGAGGACSAPAKQANGDAAMCARAGACARAFGPLDVGAELYIRDCDGRLTARMKKHEGTARHAWACSCASRKRTGARGEGRDGEREAHNLTARRLSAWPTATTRPAREEGGEAKSGKGRRRQLRAIEDHSTVRMVRGVRGEVCTTGAHSACDRSPPPAAQRRQAPPRDLDDVM